MLHQLILVSNTHSIYPSLLPSWVPPTIDDGFDPPRAKTLPNCLVVVVPVCLDCVGVLSWLHRFTFFLRDVLSRGIYAFVVGGFCSCFVDLERHALCIDQQRVLYYVFLGSIGLGPVARPLPKACTRTLSISAESTAETPAFRRPGRN